MLPSMSNRAVRARAALVSSIGPPNLGSRILVSTYCFFKQLHGRIELASLGDYDFIFAIYFPQFQSNLALPG